MSPSAKPQPVGPVSRLIPQTIGYYAALFALGLATAALGPTLPGLAQHTRSGLGAVSFLFTTAALGYMLGSILGGRLFDHLPGHTVLAAAVVLMTVTMALTPLIGLLWVLAAILLLLGAAEGAVDVGCNTLLVWAHREKVGPFMNGMHFMFGAGALVSPIIIARAVLASGDIIWAYWILALMILPAAAWLLRFPCPVAAGAHSGGERRAPAPRRLVFLIALFLSLCVGAEVGFGGLIFSYAVRLGLADETAAAYLTSVFWGALTVGRLLAIPLARRFRPRFILTGDLAVCLLSVAAIMMWPDSVATMWAGTFGLGLGMASIFPTVLSAAERRMTITGKVTGWFIVGASLSCMVLPWLIGRMFDSAGPRILMLIIEADLMAAVCVWAVLIFYSPDPETVMVGGR